MEKAKKIGFVVALGLCMGFLLVVFEVEAYHTAVKLVTDWIVKEQITMVDQSVNASRIENLPVEHQIRKVFGKDAKMALAVAKAENFTHRCDRVSKPNSNGTYDYGVFQINTVHLKKGYTEADFKDCLTNIKIAKKLFDQQGWTPWVGYTSGNYAKYL